MIVCVCKAVNQRAIRRAVAAGHDTFDALQFELGIGTCCGKCVAFACELLCEARAEQVESSCDSLHEVDVSPVRFPTAGRPVCVTRDRTSLSDVPRRLRRFRSLRSPSVARSAR